MIRFNPYKFMETLDDVYFLQAKRSFKRNEAIYANFKGNKLVAQLTEVLFSDNLLPVLDRDSYGKVLLSYFYDEFSASGTVVQYMAWLLQRLEQLTRHFELSGRIGEYNAYLYRVYDDMLAYQKAKENLDDEEVIETLIDFTRTVLNIYQVLCMDEDECEIDPLMDRIEEGTVETLTYGQFRLGRNNEFSYADRVNETKWFYYTLTWQLYCRIRQDENNSEAV